MAISTSNNLTFAIGLSDSTGSANFYRAPTMEVSFTLDDSDNATGIVNTFDTDGILSGSHPFTITSGELVAEEAGFVAALATVRAAVEQALKTIIEAIPANSGVTITYT